MPTTPATGRHTIDPAASTVLMLRAGMTVSPDSVLDGKASHAPEVVCSVWTTLTRKAAECALRRNMAALPVGISSAALRAVHADLGAADPACPF